MVSEAVSAVYFSWGSISPGPLVWAYYIIYYNLYLHLLLYKKIIGAHFSEVCGHVELCYKKENDNRTIYQFATEQFKLFREGFAYREVCSEDDMTWRKLLNKSVRLSKVY